MNKNPIRTTMKAMPSHNFIKNPLNMKRSLKMVAISQKNRLIKSEIENLKNLKLRQLKREKD